MNLGGSSFRGSFSLRLGIQFLSHHNLLFLRGNWNCVQELKRHPNTIQRATVGELHKSN